MDSDIVSNVAEHGVLSMPNPWQRRAEHWGRNAGYVLRFFRQNASEKKWREWAAEMKSDAGRNRNWAPLAIAALSLAALAGLYSARMQYRR
jgi:hypothetical protein